VRRQISITDIVVGMRVHLTARMPRGRGWVTHSDHKVISIHYFESGALMSFVLAPWIGGPQQSVEARHVLGVFAIEFPIPPMKEKHVDPATRR